MVCWQTKRKSSLKILIFPRWARDLSDNNDDKQTVINQLSTGFRNECVESILSLTSTQTNSKHRQRSTNNRNDLRNFIFSFFFSKREMRFAVTQPRPDSVSKCRALPVPKRFVCGELLLSSSHSRYLSYSNAHLSRAPTFTSSFTGMAIIFIDFTIDDNCLPISFFFLTT